MAKPTAGVSLLDPERGTAVPSTPTDRPADSDALSFLESAPTVCNEPQCVHRATHKGKCMPHYMRYIRALKDPNRAVKLKTDNTLAAKQYLKAQSFEAAQVLMAGARVAARKGDTRPAEWILLHSRAIDPVNKDGEGGPRVIVQVGLALPGLGSQLSPANPPSAVVATLPAGQLEEQ